MPPSTAPPRSSCRPRPIAATGAPATGSAPSTRWRRSASVRAQGFDEHAAAHEERAKAEDAGDDEGARNATLERAAAAEERARAFDERVRVAGGRARPGGRGACSAGRCRRRARAGARAARAMEQARGGGGRGGRRPMRRRPRRAPRCTSAGRRCTPSARTPTPHAPGNDAEAAAPARAARRRERAAGAGRRAAPAGGEASRDRARARWRPGAGRADAGGARRGCSPRAGGARARGANPHAIARRRARETEGLRRFRPGPGSGSAFYSPGMFGTASHWTADDLGRRPRPRDRRDRARALGTRAHRARPALRARRRALLGSGPLPQCVARSSRRGSRAAAVAEHIRATGAQVVASFTIAMIIPATTKTTNTTCIQSHQRRHVLHGRLIDDRLPQRDRHGVRARVGLELPDHALGVRLHGLHAQPDPPRDLLGVVALGEQLEDLALALGQRLLAVGRCRSSAARGRATGRRTPCRRRRCGSRAAGPRAASPSSRSRARPRRSRRRAGACRRRPRRSRTSRSGAAWWMRLTADTPSMPGSRTSISTTSG